MTIRLAPEIDSKAPGEDRVRNFDFSGLMATGEAIASIDSLSVSPTTTTVLTAVDNGYSGQTAQALISGGESGTQYRVTMTVTTDENQVLIGVGRISVCDAG